MKKFIVFSVIVAAVNICQTQSDYPSGLFIIKSDFNGQNHFDSVLAKNFQHAIDSITYKYLTTSGISAAIMIPDKGTWLGVSGFSTVNPIESIRTETLFHIESNTKGFVSTVVLQLAEEGKLSLDDSICQYLPPIPNVPGNITIRQLLTMRSGLWDVTNDSPAAMDSIRANPDRVWTPEEVLSTFLRPPKSLPGSGWSYCNTNLILGGMIVRDVTKTTLSVQIRQRILDPLSMTRTFFPEEEPALTPIANAWEGDVDNNRYFGHAHNSISWAAGALISTAEDAVRWANAIYGGQLLTPASQSEFLSFVPANGPIAGIDGLTFDGYGLCVCNFSFLGKRFVGHSGGAPGFSSFIMRYPETGLCIAVLLNSRYSNVNPTGEAVSALLHEYFKTMPVPAHAIPGYVYVAGGIPPTTYTMDLSTGQLTSLGESRWGTIVNCRVRPATGELIGLSNASGWELVRIDGNSGEALPFTSLSFSSPPANIKGMVFKNADTLYIGDISGKLYCVDFHTGAAAHIASTGIEIAGLDIHPQSGELWASVRPVFLQKDRIYKINIATGDTVRVGITGFGQRTVDIQFDYAGTLFGIVGSGTEINRLAKIDTATGAGTIIGSFGVSNINALALSQTLTSVAQIDVVPSEMHLAQNYPNPFNPATTIRYSVSGLSKVTLTVHDILGREIAILVNEVQSSGSKAVEWDATNSSSGIYFYTLKIGGFAKTKKMVLMK
jgi:D-alanyl-D-alanine carboxypeptidase